MQYKRLLARGSGVRGARKAKRVSRVNFGWIFHSPPHYRLLALSVLNIVMQLFGFAILIAFMAFAPAFHGLLNTTRSAAAIVVFLVILFSLLGFIVIFKACYSRLTLACKTLGFNVLVGLNTLLIIYVCYLYNFKSAVMGCYLATIPLLCLILFNISGLLRILLFLVAFITLFWGLIGLNIIPISPLFQVDILASHAGFTTYSLMVVCCLVVCLSLFLLAYDQLMVYRANRQGHLEHISQTDEVTGLLNRTHINAILQSMLLDMSHRGVDTKQVSVILADIDFFKKVNDLYGHAVGDQVLVTVAKIMRRVVEPYGYVSRYGGEEFLMALPNMSLKDAEKIAQTLRTFIENTLVVHGEANCYVTASFGVCSAQFSSHTPINIESIFKAVDQCLYSAKSTGRNKVVSKDAQKC